MTFAIPFFPPDMFSADRAAIIDLVAQVGREHRFILGERVAALEGRFQEETGAAHAIAVASGTGAVAVSLRALGIGPGDEVIVPAFCCQPVAEEVINLGARPVFVDATPDTMVMDPQCIEERLSARTKALLPAHLFCSMVDMSAVRAIADRHRLPVIEDACVQQGASQGRVKAGRWGDLGTFSFFQMKVMGGFGEGGMILTDDAGLARNCRMMRNHGQSERFHHEVIGINSRMDEIMAGCLLGRLERLEEMLERRAVIAAYYHQRLEPIGERIVRPLPGSKGRCWYMYPIQTPERDALQGFLAARGIASHIYYPRILPDQEAFRHWADHRDRLDVSRRVARENLALPIYPHLSDADVEAVADAVLAFFSDANGGMGAC